MFTSAIKLVSSAIAITIAFKIADLVVNKGMLYAASALEKGEGILSQKRAVNDNNV